MRKEKIIMTLTGIAAAFTVLSGCAAGKGADVDQEIHIAAIIGSHENAPKPNLGFIGGCCLSGLLYRLVQLR